MSHTKHTNTFGNDTVRDVSSVFDHLNECKDATLSSIELLENDDKVFEIRTMETNIKNAQRKRNERKQLNVKTNLYAL